MLRSVFFLLLLQMTVPATAFPFSKNDNGLPDFTELVENNAPAVVKIQTESPEMPGDPSQWNNGPQVPEMFRHFFEMPEQMPGPQSMGSGFIVEQDGYILTNYHVVLGAQNIVVRLSDRREFSAELLGADRSSDLALIKIDAQNLPTVTFSDPKELVKVGEWVLAIGSPFGLDYSASAGIVSAIGRSIPTERNENYVPFIQTDVAINPGNSGGPLFNLRGEVVGINSQIFTHSGGSIGLSFAIPTDVALQVYQQLKKNGHVVRGWLGVSIQDVDKDLADSFELKAPAGALVVELAPGGPASKSGVQIGDVILTYDDQKILYSSDLPHAVGKTYPGTQVTVNIVREGKPKTLQIEVGELATDAPVSRAARPNDEAISGAILGLILEPLAPDQLRQLGIDAGVLVTQVLPGSAAFETGLQPGDVITQLGFDNIDSVNTFARVTENLPPGSLQPIRFFRRAQPVFRTIVIR